MPGPGNPNNNEDPRGQSGAVKNQFNLGDDYPDYEAGTLVQLDELEDLKNFKNKVVIGTDETDTLSNTFDADGNPVETELTDLIGNVDDQLDDTPDGDTRSAMESIGLIDTDGDDESAEISDVVDLGAGNDQMWAGGGNDIILGGDGNDVIRGEAGDDVLFGEGGNDVLNGGEGADYLNGGDGNDTASYDGSEDGVTVNLSDGTASGGDAEGDVLVDIENLVGSEHGDTLTGDDNANEIEGGDGDDVIAGLGGDDILSGGDGDDTITGGEGDDTIHGGAGEDTINGNQGDDTIHGGAGNDFLQGGKDNDTLFGDAGADTIEGNLGDDTITGGAGADTLTGGDGTDTFVFNSADEGNDTITDFDTSDPAVGDGDLLDISAALDGFTGSTVQDAVDDGFLAFVDDGTGDTQVQVDEDGGGDNLVDLALLSGVGFTDETTSISDLEDNFIV